ESGPTIDRMLTVGAQYAYWRDYAQGHRTNLFLKWHVVMPALTALFGYFPGRKLGWLEDLPAGVANEWSFRRARMELSYPAGMREEVVPRFAAISAPVLASAVSDDELGTSLHFAVPCNTIAAPLQPKFFSPRKVWDWTRSATSACSTPGTHRI